MTNMVLFYLSMEKENAKKISFISFAPNVNLLRGHDVKLFSFTIQTSTGGIVFSQTVVTRWTSPPENDVSTASSSSSSSRGNWKRGTGKRGIISQGWKSQDWKTEDQFCRGGKRGTTVYGTRNVYLYIKYNSREQRKIHIVLFNQSINEMQLKSNCCT